MVLALKIVLFLSVLFTVYSLLSYSRDNKLLTGTAIKIFNISEERYNKRKEKKEKIRIEEGNIRDKSFLGKIDLLILRSNIKNRIPFFNTEIYISFSITLFATGFLLGDKLFNHWLVGLILALLSTLILYASIYFIAAYNYERIDKESLTFANMLENYSVTTDDIVSIMDQSSVYLKQPLKGYIEEFVSDVARTGDSTIAFRNLEYKIESERVRNIIRNLEICSRHEANYKEIITDNRDTLKEHLKAKEQRKSLINNGRMEIIICYLMCSVILYVFTSFVPNLRQLLTETFLGNLILTYNIVVMAVIFWNLISFDKRG